MPSATIGAQVLVSGSQVSGSIPTGAAGDEQTGEWLGWSPTATSVPSGTPVMATSGSTNAARTVPLAAFPIPVRLAGPSARPTAPLIDLALEALPPLGWLESDLATGLLRPARRRR